MIIKPSHKLADVGTYYFVRKLSEIEQMNSDGQPPIINLGIGSPDLLPPHTVIEALNQDLDRDGAHQYQSYKGLHAFRQSYAAWYLKYFSVQVDAGTEILPLLGSKEGVMHVSMAFLDKGDEVLVPNPGYPSYGQCARLAGATVIDMPLAPSRGWQPDLISLEDTDLSRVKMMWINYPNMPTGARADIRFFERLLAFAERHNILICHDNPYVFILNDYPMSILQVDSEKKYSLELTSLSKIYNMAGWRVGALTSNKEIIDTVMTFKSNMDSGMFRPLQVAGIEALAQGDDWFNRLNDTYTKRKKIAAKIMDALGLTYDMDGGTLFLWGKIPEGQNAIDFADQILTGARVFITPGSVFGSVGDEYLRISLCSSTEQLMLALDRIMALNMNFKLN
jgi:LL-diaminopimelate aminotransferase